MPQVSRVIGPMLWKQYEKKSRGNSKTARVTNNCVKFTGGAAGLDTRRPPAGMEDVAISEVYVHRKDGTVAWVADGLLQAVVGFLKINGECKPVAANYGIAWT